MNQSYPVEGGGKRHENGDEVEPPREEREMRRLKGRAEPIVLRPVKRSSD